MRTVHVCHDGHGIARVLTGGVHRLIEMWEGRNRWRQLLRNMLRGVAIVSLRNSSCSFTITHYLDGARVIVVASLIDGTISRKMVVICRNRNTIEINLEKSVYSIDQGRKDWMHMKRKNENIR